MWGRSLRIYWAVPDDGMVRNIASEPSMRCLLMKPQEAVVEVDDDWEVDDGEVLVSP